MPTTTVPPYTDEKSDFAYRIATQLAARRCRAAQELKEVLARGLVGGALARAEAAYRLANDAYVDAVRLLDAVRFNSEVHDDRQLDQAIDLEIFGQAYGGVTPKQGAEV